MKFSNEIKAGIVVLAAIAVGILFFGKTTNFTTDSYELITFFDYASDLTPDAIVKLAGIEVGRVKKIEFVYDTLGTRVKCTLDLPASARVREDSVAYIGTAGFVGDAYIGITAGSSMDFLDSGETVTSEEPVQMRLLMQKADAIAENLDNILIDVKAVVSDNKQGLNNIVGNLEITTENFKEFSEDVKKHPWKLMFKGE